MSGEQSENEAGQLLSSYGMITAERILGGYHIKLAPNDLFMAIKTPVSFYHRLLKVPLKNVLNGIVMQQANDYHVYVQKLFIDYLLSGESSREEAEQGALTREAMEEERKKLVDLGDEYNLKEAIHANLIASSQASFIKITNDFNVAYEKTVSAIAAEHKTISPEAIRQAINSALIKCNLTDPHASNNNALFVEQMSSILKDIDKDKTAASVSDLLAVVLSLDETMEPFLYKAREMCEQANSFRDQFYETILRTINLIKLLPEYKIEPMQDAVNREPLLFDKQIGATE